MNEFQKFLVKQEEKLEEDREIYRRVEALEARALDLHYRITDICNVLHLEAKDD